MAAQCYIMKIIITISHLTLGMQVNMQLFDEEWLKMQRVFKIIIVVLTISLVVAPVHSESKRESLQCL